MVKETIEKLFHDLEAGQKDCFVQMKEDFQIVARELNELYGRTERIVTVSTASISIAKAGRGLELKRVLVRLTYLAVIFAPLIFISGLFGMAPELGQLANTMWIYFVVAIPVSLIAFLLVESPLRVFLKTYMLGYKIKKR
jgi:Mg2+ and Co2+ transporter CorA